MSKPNEIDEAVLKERLRMALREQLPIVQQSAVDKAYEDGRFSDFVGVVGRATKSERERAAQTARRLGHSQTARVIADGK